MNTNDIFRLYRYNQWANAKLLDAAAKLSPEQQNQDLGGSFPTVRRVIAHLVVTEWAWLQRWCGVNPAAVPNWSDGEVPELAAQLKDIEKDRAMFLNGLSDDALKTRIDYKYLSGNPGSGEVQDLLVHVVNHATYHRGQLAAMIRQLGNAPPSTDFVFFRAEEAS